MSRYYDPVTHRFINADGYFQSGGDILDANMSAYCGNNPIIRSDPDGKFWGIVIGIVAAIVTTVVLSSCSSSKPRSDLASANTIVNNTASELSRLRNDSYNCYGNGIGKQTNTSPTGYTPGDSTRKTFNAVKNDLGTANVRELSGISAPIEPNEFKVAMRCGPSDYHFIRQLSDGSWYNKSGLTTGLVIPESYVINGPYGDGMWYGVSEEHGISLPLYDDEIIYFAVKIGWDTQ